MFSSRQQAMIEAPVEAVWELLGDPNRHPEWRPRVLEVECADIGEGCKMRRVDKGPLGLEDHEMVLERLDDCHAISIRCPDTGLFNHFTVTEAAGGTFIDAEFGSEPQTAGRKVLGALAGKRMMRMWLDQSIEGLREAACEPSAQPATPPAE